MIQVKAKEILESKLNDYNDTVSQVYQFAFSKAETKLFTDMMVDFANAHAIGFSEWKEENNYFYSKLLKCWLQSGNDGGNTFTIEELLEIYNNTNP